MELIFIEVRFYKCLRILFLFDPGDFDFSAFLTRGLSFFPPLERLFFLQTEVFRHFPVFFSFLDSRLQSFSAPGEIFLPTG